MKTAALLLMAYCTVPVGDTHGAAQVTVNVPTAVIDAGDMSSLNVAAMDELAGTFVGPGVEVTGTVELTTGRVMSWVAPVVKVHT